MPSATVDWFRDPTWDGPTRVDFEARLARAQPRNRQEYLYLKGLSLRAAGHVDAARELLERAAAHPDGYLHGSASAWETLADMAVERGDPAAAERLYRRILEEQPSGSGTSGTVEISLAELLLDRGRTEDRDDASILLSAWINRSQPKFDSQLFRWHVNLIRLAQATGDRELARRAAGTALTLAERGPRLPRHPDVGLVETDEDTLEKLRQLAR